MRPAPAGGNAASAPASGSAGSEESAGVPDLAAPAAGLGAELGLCQGCRHGKVNTTRRGTAYLRCTRAGWDARLPRYPRLPMQECHGFLAR